MSSFKQAFLLIGLNNACEVNNIFTEVAINKTGNSNQEIHTIHKALQNAQFGLSGTLSQKCF